MSQETFLSGNTATFEPHEIIVSKTDLKGRLTYTNRVFMRLAGYDEHNLLGQPHSIIRHPDMPRCVFKLLWDTIAAGEEIFAYVVNRSRNGDHYWVLAHVTPSFSASGEIDGYHSNRRVPDMKIVNDTIAPLYKQLLAEERAVKNTKDGMNNAAALLNGTLKEHGVKYDEFVFSL